MYYNISDNTFCTQMWVRGIFFVHRSNISWKIEGGDLHLDAMAGQGSDQQRYDSVDDQRYRLKNCNSRLSDWFQH